MHENKWLYSAPSRKYAEIFSLELQSKSKNAPFWNTTISI
jgi:hypothetical protein